MLNVGYSPRLQDIGNSRKWEKVTPLEPMFESLVANYRKDMLQNSVVPLALSCQSL